MMFYKKPLVEVKQFIRRVERSSPIVGSFKIFSLNTKQKGGERNERSEKLDGKNDY